MKVGTLGGVAGFIFPIRPIRPIFSHTSHSFHSLEIPNPKKRHLGLQDYRIFLLFPQLQRSALYQPRAPALGTRSPPPTRAESPA